MTVRVSIVLLIAAAAGCAQTQEAATDVQSAVQAQATPTLSTADATFVNEAGRAGITEVTFGQLARAQGARAAVRDFGLRMVTEHTTANQQLTQLAAAKQITPITTVDAAHQSMYDALAAQKGRAFDRGYLDREAADHAAMLAMFQDEAAHGTDADVRAFAAREAPMIQAHLDLAHRLGGRLTVAGP